MEQKITKREGVQLAKKRLKQLLSPLGFHTYPRTTDQFIRVRDEFIDRIHLYHAHRTGFNLDCYISPRFAPFTWLKCDEERLWRAARKPISNLHWNTNLLLENGLDYFEAVWHDMACALKRHVLPEMENMTIEIFLSRQVLPSEDMRDIFLPYQIIDLNGPCSICSPLIAGHGIELWHLRKFEEGAPYLYYASQGYHAQLSGCKENEKDVFQRQFMELALLEELLSLWERKEGDWMLAIQQRIDQIATNWIMYI